MCEKSSCNKEVAVHFLVESRLLYSLEIDVNEYSIRGTKDCFKAYFVLLMLVVEETTCGGKKHV